MTSTGVSGAAGLRRIMASFCRLCELEQVVGGADHRPFLSDLVEAAEQELSKASGRFALAEHRLDDLLSEAISAAPAGAAELRCHGGDARALARSALAGRVAAAMPRPARGEIGGDAPPGEEGEIGLVAISGIGREFGGTGAQGAADRLDQGHERAAVRGAGLHALRDDDLVRAIDGDLRIVALDHAVA